MCQLYEDRSFNTVRSSYSVNHTPYVIHAVGKRQSFQILKISGM